MFHYGVDGLWGSSTPSPGRGGHPPSQVLRKQPVGHMLDNSEKSGGKEKEGRRGTRSLLPKIQGGVAQQQEVDLEESQLVYQGRVQAWAVGVENVSHVGEHLLTLDTGG